jgi:tRNA(fMet)-specific endonuclease VapC
MDRTVICLDTTVLIDYFRRQDKRKSLFVQLAKHYDFALSVITKLEILNGSNDDQKPFWNTVFQKSRMLALGEAEVDCASLIIKQLRTQNQMIELPDILIGATAKVHHLSLATLNTKHFQRIEGLTFVSNLP